MKIVMMIAGRVEGGAEIGGGKKKKPSMNWNLKKSTIESEADVDTTDPDEASRVNLLKGWYSEDVLRVSKC